MANFTGYYLDEYLLNYPEQAAIIKLTIPSFFIRFNYDEKYISDLEHFKENINEETWLDDHTVHSDEDRDKILQECFDFLIERRKAGLNLPEHE